MGGKADAAEAGYDVFITDPGDNPGRVRVGIEEFSGEKPGPLGTAAGYKDLAYGSAPVVSGVPYRTAREVESRLREVGAEGVEIRPSAPRRAVRHRPAR